MCLYTLIMSGLQRWKTDEEKESYPKHDGKGHRSKDGSHSDMSEIEKAPETNCKEAT